MDRRRYLAVLAASLVPGCASGIDPPDAIRPGTDGPTPTPSETPAPTPTRTGTATRGPTAAETEDPAISKNERRLENLQRVVQDMHDEFLESVEGDVLTDVTAAFGGMAVGEINELRNEADALLRDVRPRNARQERIKAGLDLAVTFYSEGASCQSELGDAHRDLEDPVRNLNSWERFELRNRSGLAKTHATFAETRLLSISGTGGSEGFQFVDAVDPEDYAAKMDQWERAIENVRDLVAFVEDFTEGNDTLEDARSKYAEGEYGEAEDLAGQAADAFATLLDAVEATNFTDGFSGLAVEFERVVPVYERDANELRTDAMVAQIGTN